MSSDPADMICQGNIDQLASFINANSVDFRIESEDNDPLLNYAISDQQTEVWKWLLDSGADTTLTNDEGENLIHASVYSGKVDRVLLASTLVNVNHRSADGSTALLLATALGKPEVVQCLIASGADVNIPDNDQNYPIHIAAQKGMLETIDHMIRAGSFLKVKTLRGNTAIALAANNDQDDVVRLLFNRIYRW